jgi:hypothetical protein
MEDAVLACVLFDCRNETNLFEGATDWSQALDQARMNTKLKKLLVASRIERGQSPRRQRADRSLRPRERLAPFIPTSASTGDTPCRQVCGQKRGGSRMSGTVENVTISMALTPNSRLVITQVKAAAPMSPATIPAPISSIPCRRKNSCGR